MKLYELLNINPHDILDVDIAIRLVLPLISVILTSIEISPLKFNPWSSLFRWIWNKASEKTTKQLSEISKEVAGVKDAMHEMQAMHMRFNIQNFADNLRQGLRRTNRQFMLTLSHIDYYEHYCEENKLENGLVEADIEYIKAKYKQQTNQETEDEKDAN